MEDTVLVSLQLSPQKLNNENVLEAIFDLEDILSEVIDEHEVGYLDGNELSDDCVTFFLYGEDADLLHQVIMPILLHLPNLPGSYVVKRYSDGREQTVSLSWAV